jgi:ribosomal protein S18 acetylase RimI-like enzyme
VIRPAVAADGPELFAIRRAAILACAVPAMSEDLALAWADAHPPAWIHVLIRERVVLVGCRRDGQVIGWVSTMGGSVDGLYVSPPHAGRGVGRGLLRGAEQVIAARGYAEVRLDASVNAQRFYAGLGYEPAGPRHPEDGPTFGAQPMVKPVAVRDDGPAT